MRSPGRDRRAGRAHRAGSTGPRSGPRRGPHGPRPGAGASRQGAGGDGPQGAADGGPRERVRGTRPAAAGGPGRRQGTVGGNASRAAPWHHDSPRSAPRPRASFVTLGSWIFSRFRFRERFGPLKSAADGRVWCHNFAKPERNEVLAPRRHPPSLAPCLADPAAGDREWCHNFAKHGRNEVMAPEGPGNPAYRPPGDGCPRGCNGGRIRGPTKCAAGPEPMPLGCEPMFKNERFMTRSEPSWIACRIAGRSRS